MSITFFANGSAGNHGCEALTRSIYKILNNQHDITFASISIAEDKKYIHDVNLKFSPLEYFPTKNSIRYRLYQLKQHFNYSDKRYFRLKYSKFHKSIQSGNIYISIGGDNYSYKGCEWLEVLSSGIKKMGGNLILLGCSVLENITEVNLIKNLNEYDIICTRESISLSALKKAGIKSILYNIPDPAFQLDRKDLPLPNGFIEGNTVGINVSPMIISYEKNKGQTLENYIYLMQHIINTTDMNIALIPHVVWNHNDDRIPLQLLYDRFKGTDRVVMIEDCNAEELKGYIARCRFMVVARTHASIAAYSTCVPTLVVGYSVKAKGIAKDIFGTYENYVIPVQSLQNKEDLTISFRWLQENETSIKNHLNNFIPEYCERVWELRDIITI